MPPAPVTIRLEPEPADLVRSTLAHGLRAFNTFHVPAPEFQGLVIAARDGQEIVGGLSGETGWQWLHVAQLWVAQSHRNQGIGAQLLQAAEAEALRRGARHVYLETYDFQAREFYERRGYVVFGIHEDFPPGHKRYHLRRDLPWI